MRIDTVEANARIAALHVKRTRFLSRCIHQVCQHWAYYRPHAQVLAKYRPQTPQGRAEVKQTFAIPRDMAKLFKRDAQTQDCRFVNTTAIRNLWRRLDHVRQG